MVFGTKENCRNHTWVAYEEEEYTIEVRRVDFTTPQCSHSGWHPWVRLQQEAHHRLWDLLKLNRGQRAEVHGLQGSCSQSDPTGSRLSKSENMFPSQQQLFSAVLLKERSAFRWTLLLLILQLNPTPLPPLSMNVWAAQLLICFAFNELQSCWCPAHCSLLTSHCSLLRSRLRSASQASQPRATGDPGKH